MTKLTEKKVEEIFQDCLYHDNDRGSWIGVNGVILQASFEPIRLEKYKAEVCDMLKQLPKKFDHNEGGDGDAFVNMVKTRDSERSRWTDHEEMADKLLCLALAMNLARYLLLREYWQYHPGGAMIIFFL